MATNDKDPRDPKTTKTTKTTGNQNQNQGNEDKIPVPLPGKGENPDFPGGVSEPGGSGPTGGGSAN